jgi:hypothetical protein
MKYNSKRDCISKLNELDELINCVSKTTMCKLN